MSVARGSRETAQIHADDFVGLPALFDQWAMATGASDMRAVAQEALQAIGRSGCAGLYVLQGSRPIPLHVREAAWIGGLEVLDTEDGVPLRFAARDHAAVLAAVYRAYVVDRRGADDFMRGSGVFFRLGAVGIRREEAADALRARAEPPRILRGPLL